MAAVEEKVASVILGAIRSKKTPEVAVPFETAPAYAPARLREAAFDDFQQVMELRRNAGWPVDSMENWNRIWLRNPALEFMLTKPAIGWVLEAEGKVVGYLGNIPILYHYRDRPLVALTGSGLVAQALYRSSTFSLNAAFYGQKIGDFFLTTTAVESVGRIARAFKSVPLPQADYDTVLFWVLDPDIFAASVVKKLGIRTSLSAVSRKLASFALRTDKTLRRRRPHRFVSRFTVKEIGVSEIGQEFDDLWAKKLAERPRLLADRRSSTLRWHFGGCRRDDESTRVLCCYDGDEFVGYAIVRCESITISKELRRSIVADMIAKEDNPEIIRALWGAAYEQAKGAGSHVFEVLGFPPEIRRISESWRPYFRKYPACPFYYKVSNPTLHDILSDANVWYASPFDGDTTLWNFGSAS